MLVRESEGDHRLVAAATGDSNAGIRTCATSSSLAVKGARLGCLHPRCAKSTEEHRFKVH